MLRGLVLATAAAAAAWAHEPITTKLTWTKEISRIVYHRCASCHHEGGRAPMPLLTYEEARPWAKAIRDEVLERRMPPWGAVKGFGEFRDDASLSEREIELLVNWVEGGAPEGDPVYLPPAPRKFEAAPPPQGNAAKIALPAKLARETLAVGVEPAGEGQFVARRPDGSFVPLLWLMQMRPTQPKAYYYREPIRLPAGTVVEGTGRLIISGGSRGR